MSETLTLVFLLLAFAMLVFIIVLICRHLFEIFEEPGIQKRIRQLNRNSQPWVTVLLYVRNNEKNIEASLKALLKSRYYHYDIVVVNNRSNDASARKVQDFIALHPNAPIQLLNRRVNSSAAESLKAGYKKSKRGTVVISLQAGAIVAPSFIKQAVATKAERKQATLTINESTNTNSLSGIIQALNNSVWQQSYKAWASDSKNITFAENPIRLEFIGIFLLVGIIATSLFLNETIVFWYGWLIATSYVYSVIWLNEETVVNKLKLSFSALSAFFLLPVASLAQGFSQFSSRN